MDEAEIAARLSAIEARLDELEARPRSDAATAEGSPPEAGEDTGRRPADRDADVFWVLDGLRSRIGGNGGVTYAGSVTIADGPVDWQIGATTDQLMSVDWSEFAADLAALGHPTRLTLLQAVIGGAHSVAELSAMEGMGSTGQLYHHLGQLSSHGWLTMAGRGNYVVPAQRVVPLFVIISATRRMS